MRAKKEQAVVLNSPDQTQEYFLQKWDQGSINEIEHFYVAYLGYDDRLIEFELHNTGTESMVSVYTERILRKAVKLYAAKIIVAHNHPNGDIRPSQPDFETTRKLYNSCKAVSIELADHFIFGSNRDKRFSFRQSGLLNEYEKNYNTIKEIAEEGSFSNIAFKIIQEYIGMRKKYNEDDDFMLGKVNQNLNKLYVKFFDPIFPKHSVVDAVCGSHSINQYITNRY